MQATGFLPSRDGFPFRNDFEYPASRLGRGAPLAPGFGLAGGMCLAALDRWHAGRPLPVPPATPAPDDVLHEELLRRQVELLGHGAWDRILEWQRRPGVGRLFREDGVGELTLAEWRRVRRSLEAGTPVLLCVLRTRGPFANPSENPIVLAYRYEHAKDTKRGTIWVYDPNRPGNDDVRLTIVPGGRRRAPEVMFMAERVRGFFVLPYDRPVATPLDAQKLEDVEAGGFTGRAASLPGAGANAVVRARNGGLVVVRGGKAGSELRTQRIEGDVLASDPVVVTGRTPTIVVRAKDGILLGFRRGVSGWRGRPLPSAKTPLELDFGPALVSARGRVHVFGVKDGRLAHMLRTRAGMWSAGVVNAQTGAGATEALEGKPSALVDRSKVIRVFTRTQGGRIAHMALSPDGRWSATLLPAADGAIAGDAVAVIVPDDDQITVFAVSEEGELIQFRGAGDTWRARNLTRETSHDGGPHRIRVEIAVSPGPGSTLHVFGISPLNGLVHYWCPPTLAWRAQDLTHGRAEMGDAARVRGRPSVVRTADDQLVVAAAAERGLVVYRWSAASDWTGDVLPMPSGYAERMSPEGPVLWRDARGQAHLFAVFEDGRAVMAVPGRPDSAQRTMRVQPTRATVRARPSRAPETTAATAGREEPAQPSTGTFVDAALDDSSAVHADAQTGTAALDLDAAITGSGPFEPAADLGAGEAMEPMSFDTFDSLEVGGVEPGGLDAAATDEQAGLLDLGGMAIEPMSEHAPNQSGGLDIGFGAGDADEAADDEEAGADRDGWGSYGADALAVPRTAKGGFQPAAPLLPDPDATHEPIELPDELTLPSTAEQTQRNEQGRARKKEEAEERAREKAEEEENARLKAEKEKAERKKAEEERARLKAEKEKAERKKAEEEERARLKAEKEKAERKKAEEEERARLKAEKEKAERKKAEEEERARKKAEDEERARLKAEEERARKKAEEEERARLKAEKAARKKAEEEERARLEAEKAALKKAEEEERARVKAEEKARLEAEEKARLAAEEKARLAAEEKARLEAEAAARRKAEEQKRPSRPVSPALEGLPLLDDDTPPRERVPTESAKPAPAKDSSRPKPKLRSMNDLIRLADEQDPTFEKKK